MTTLTLLHTAEVHVATFDALRDQMAPEAQLRHVVRAEWLDRAQGGGDPTLGEDIRDEIIQAGRNCLCTCSTIGPLAEVSGALRIDTPMMDRAAEIGGRGLMAFCLNSTRAPSLALLAAAGQKVGRSVDVDLCPMPEAWALFEAGDEAAYLNAIATRVNEAAQRDGPYDWIMLAQASMADAADQIGQDVPVLTSPRLALLAALGLGA